MSRYPLREYVKKYVASKKWSDGTKEDRVRKFKMMTDAIEFMYGHGMIKNSNPKMWKEEEVKVMEDWFDSKDLGHEAHIKYRNMLMYLCEFCGNYIYKEMYKKGDLVELVSKSNEKAPPVCKISLVMTSGNLKVVVSENGNIEMDNDRGKINLSQLEYMIKEGNAFVDFREARNSKGKEKPKPKQGLQTLFEERIGEAKKKPGAV